MADILRDRVGTLGEPALGVDAVLIEFDRAPRRGQLQHAGWLRCGCLHRRELERTARWLRWHVDYGAVVHDPHARAFGSGKRGWVRVLTRVASVAGELLVVIGVFGCHVGSLSKRCWHDPPQTDGLRHTTVRRG